MDLTKKLVPSFKPGTDWF